MRGVSAWREFYPVKPGFLMFRIINYCLKKPYKTYIGDVRCDAGRVFDYTSYFVTVGLSNTVCVCFLPIHSGHQVRWTYQPGSHRRKVTQDF